MGPSAWGRVAALAAAMAMWMPAARADTPGHNPDLDSRCGPGFQWSRMTVACEQANCPPGASRTYTLECSCGEAWNKPFRTCMDKGLATHCVAKGQSCGDVVSGFDPLTGGCKTGFEKGADGACTPVFPERFRCKLQKLDGSPIAHEVTVGERAVGSAPTAFGNAQKVRAGADGSFEVALGDRRSAQIVLGVRGLDGYPIQSIKISVDRQPAECVFIVTSDADAETFVKDEYADLLGRACVDQAAIDKVRAVAFATGEPVKVPQYDAAGKRIRLGGRQTWDEQERTLFHEFGHAISDTVIDPSYGYIKGVPIVGKFVGGGHDNWKPNEQHDDWGPDIDPEEQAFEEGLADFLAMLRYHARGQSYQADLESDARALQALKEHGRGAGVRMEGVVTAFLRELYADELAKGPDGAARVMGDLIRSINYERRNNLWGYSARTLGSFVANKAQRDKAESDPCTVKARDLEGVASKYGLGPRTSVRIEPTSHDPAAVQRARETAARMAWDAKHGGLAPKPGEDYQVPAGSGYLTFETFDADFAMSGRTRVIKFSPERDSHFRLDGRNMMFVGEGLVEVKNADVTTPHGQVRHQGTSYVVDVTAEATRVAVADGAVELAMEGAPPLVVAAGEGAIAARGAAAPEKTDGKLLERAEPGADEADDAGGGLPGWLIHVPWIALLAAIPIVLLVMRRR